MPATITITHPRPGAARLVPAGELDIAALADLRAVLSATRGCTDVVVQASGVDFIDCAGLRPLVGAARAAAGGGGRLVLRDPSPAVVDLIAWCSLEEQLPVEAAPTPGRGRLGRRQAAVAGQVRR